MAFAEVLEPFERLLAETFSPEIIRAIDTGADWEPAWTKVEQSGYLDAIVSEEKGGFGLGWDVACALFQALGRHAAPLPVGETMIMRWLSGEAGANCPEGPVHLISEEGSLRSRLSEYQPGSLLRLESAKDLKAYVYAAQIAGASARALEMSVGYANERQQFGKPIGRQQAVQQKLAVMAQETVAVRLAVELPCEGGRLPTGLAAKSAIATACRYAASIASAAHAVHGAIGISAEYDLQLYTKSLHRWRLAVGGATGFDESLGRALFHSDESLLDWIRTHVHG